MADFTKEFLSGSTNGRGIKVVATATAGTVIHTAQASTKDEVWMWCGNDEASTDRQLTIEFGGVTDSDDLVQVTIPFKAGPTLVIPGWILSGSLIVRAFGAAANVLNIHGFVNRIT